MSYIEDNEDSEEGDSFFGSGSYSTLNKKIELRDHPNNIVDKGLFATSLIKKGEIVWEDNNTETNKTIKIDNLSNVSKEQYDFIVHYCYQIDDNEFIIPSGGVGNKIEDYADYTNVFFILK
jgi:hypothetical protein